MFGFIFWWIVIWLMMFGACSQSWLHLVGVYGYTGSYVLSVTIACMYCYWTCRLADEHMKDIRDRRQSKFLSLVLFLSLVYICAPSWVIGGGIMYQMGDVAKFLYGGVFLFSLVAGIGIYMLGKSIRAFYGWVGGE